MKLAEALIAASIISFSSYFARFLTLSGAAATFLLAVPIYGLGGWRWTVPILTFFISSSVLSRVKADGKKEVSSMFAKSSRRDAGQVAANGGIAGLLVLIWWYTGHEIFYLVYLGAICAVTADTWSTELGILSKRPPRLITNFAVVPRGTSGAVTTLGTLAGLVGTVLIFFSGFAWYDRISAEVGSKLSLFVILLFAGTFGNIVDSFLGATLQAQYACASCGKITEHRTHCSGASTNLVRGSSWITNDVVNLLCSAVGAAAAFTAASMMKIKLI